MSSSFLFQITTVTTLLLADYDVDKKIEGIREYFKEI